MTDTTISILQKAADLGLKLGVKASDTLTVNASRAWPKEFAITLQAHKPQLLDRLRLPFVMVYSETLQETIFLCKDEDTKAALVEAGADPWSIYAKDELRVLLAQNRIAPISLEELARLHEIKRTFNAKIAN